MNFLFLYFQNKWLKENDSFNVKLLEKLTADY